MRSRSLPPAASALVALACSLGCGAGAPGEEVPAAVDGAPAGPDADLPPDALERDAAVEVDLDTLGLSVPVDFVGMSLEVPLVGSYLGRAPDQLNGMFLQLLRNLGPGTLRVGGATTDTSCWRTSPGAALPAGCAIEISANALRIIARSMDETGWRALLGVDLGHYSPGTALDFARDGVAAAFAGELRGKLLGLQFGHEPNLYASQARRGAGYDHPDFTGEWNAYADAIAGEASTAWIRTAGPTYGARSSWFAHLSAFLTAAGSRLSGPVTVHDAPLSGCGGAPAPTVGDLLAEETMYESRKRITLAAETAVAAGAELQLDQVTSVQCNGQDGVSNTFASAVWGVDYALSMVASGASRVNFHNASGAYYDPVVSSEQETSPGQWSYSTRVLPLYYGMLLASRAAGGRLVPARVTDGELALSVHAVRAPDGAVLVYLVNRDLEAGGQVAVSPSAVRGAARAITLRAPSLTARAEEVSLGGAQVDGGTGVIAEPAAEEVPVASARGTYVVDVPHASVVLLVIPAG